MGVQVGTLRMCEDTRKGRLISASAKAATAEPLWRVPWQIESVVLVGAIYGRGLNTVITNMMVP